MYPTWTKKDYLKIIDEGIYSDMVTVCGDSGAPIWLNMRIGLSRLPVALGTHTGEAVNGLGNKGVLLTRKKIDSLVKVISDTYSIDHNVIPLEKFETEAKRHPSISPAPILTAIFNDDVQEVDTLLKDESSVARSMNMYPYSPLFFAIVYNKSLEVIDMLAQHIDLNRSFWYVSPRGNTWNSDFRPNKDRYRRNIPLHTAVVRNKIEIVKILVTRQLEEINFQDEMGRTALHKAIIQGNEEIAALLLKCSASPNIEDYDGKTALHLAAQYGRENLVALLLDDHSKAKVKVKVNAQDKAGDTPLHEAAKYNRTAIAFLLMKHKDIEINKPDKDKYTPLHRAAEQGNIQLASALLTHAEEEGEYGTQLHLAAMRGHAEMVSLLLKKKSNVCACIPPLQRMPLHLAATHGHTNVVELLIGTNFLQKIGYKIDLLKDLRHLEAVDRKGYTALHLAAKYGYIDVVRLLLKEGADINARDKLGETPLHKAVKKKQKNIVVDLLKYPKLDLKIRDKTDRTCLHWAAMRGLSDIALSLIDRGAMLNEPDYVGDLPLHLAIESKNEDLAELLIAKGSDVNHANNNGKDPLKLAEQVGSAQLIALINERRQLIDM